MKTHIDDLDAKILYTIEELGRVPQSRNVWIRANVSAVCRRLDGWASASTIERRVAKLASAGLVVGSREVRTARSIRSERATFRG